MKTRPILVTLISLLFMIAGALGIIYHFNDLMNLNLEAAGIFIVRLLAVVGGIFSFRGASWARWLLLAWMGFHVVISFYHTNLEVMIHIGFFLLALYSLFNKSASAFFAEKS